VFFYGAQCSIELCCAWCKCDCYDSSTQNSQLRTAIK